MTKHINSPIRIIYGGNICNDRNISLFKELAPGDIATEKLIIYNSREGDPIHNIKLGIRHLHNYEDVDIMIGTVNNLGKIDYVPQDGSCTAMAYISQLEEYEKQDFFIKIVCRNYIKRLKFELIGRADRDDFV